LHEVQGCRSRTLLMLCGYGETEETLNETFENSKKIERTPF
jgi:hypothetical protein